MIFDEPVDLRLNPATVPYVYNIDPQPAPAPSRRVPTEYQIRRWADELISLFDNGFEWGDLARMIHYSNGFLEDFSYLPLLERRAIVAQVLFALIDMTDTPYLPDSFTDPLFKAMVPPFIALMLPDEPQFSQPLEGVPSHEMIQESARAMLQSFKDGLQWEDLSAVAQFAVRFSQRCPDLTAEEKAAVAIEIVDFAIDETDTPYLPDAFSDPIFKALLHPMIALIFDAENSP